MGILITFISLVSGIGIYIYILQSEKKQYKISGEKELKERQYESYKELRIEACIATRGELFCKEVFPLSDCCELSTIMTKLLSNICSRFPLPFKSSNLPRIQNIINSINEGVFRVYAGRYIFLQFNLECVVNANVQVLPLAIAKAGPNNIVVAQQMA